jgi:lipid A 3-O-deacylase
MPLLLAAALAAVPASARDIYSLRLPDPAPAEPAAPATPEPFRMPTLSLDPPPEPEAPQRASLTPSTERAKFGDAGSQWATLTLGVADDLSASTDTQLAAAWSRFLVKDVEWMLEASVWYFHERLDSSDRFGLNTSMVFRWHFLNDPEPSDRWSVFGDAGIGVLATTNNVPPGGTGLNFTPRFGVGGTYRLGDTPVRLIGGVRWHHISNARIHGERRNPSRDAAMFYVGVIFPF